MLDNYKCVYEKLAKKKHLADCNDAYAKHMLYFNGLKIKS